MAERTKTTEDAILTAAADLFAERGYAATTTRAIAERAGVNEVTLFRRFTNKAGILDALTTRLRDAMAGFQVASMPDPDDVPATLEALTRMEIETAVRGGALAIRMAVDAASVPEIAALMGDGPMSNMLGLAAYFADRQKAGLVRDDVTPELMAEAFFAVTSTMVMSRQMLRVGGTAALGSDDSIRQIVAIFYGGVRKGEGR